MYWNIRYRKYKQSPWCSGTVLVYTVTSEMVYFKCCLMYYVAKLQPRVIFRHIWFCLFLPWVSIQWMCFLFRVLHQVHPGWCKKESPTSGAEKSPMKCVSCVVNIYTIWRNLLIINLCPVFGIEKIDEHLSPRCGAVVYNCLHKKVLFDILLTIHNKHHFAVMFTILFKVWP